VNYLSLFIEINRTAATEYLLGDLIYIGRDQWVAADKAIVFSLIGRERPKDETPIFDLIVATSQMTGKR
jgi:poly-D-alanine transfer protein DltD